MGEKEEVAKEIQEIAEEYRSQMKERGRIGTPGGLEPMGDVWRLISKWDTILGGSGLY